MKELEQRIAKIEKRNKRVETDKAWETSWTRRICIMVLTYLVVVAYSYIIRECDNILLSSLVPVLGFLLSTLSVKAVRRLWEKKNKQLGVIIYLTMSIFGRKKAETDPEVEKIATQKDSDDYLLALDIGTEYVKDIF